MEGFGDLEWGDQCMMSGLLRDRGLRLGLALASPEVQVSPCLLPPYVGVRLCMRRGGVGI
jgi:hypothetical protein